MATQVVQPKWALKSMTVLGGIISVLVTGYQVVGPILDAVGVTVPVTTEDIQNAGNVASNVIVAVGGLAGFALTIWGRFRAGKAVQPISVAPNAPPVAVKVAAPPATPKATG